MEQRRFLAINFWIGSRDDGYLVGPVLVSTSDYERFHFWDEPSVALLDADDYEIVKLYPRGLGYDEVTRQFATDSAPTAIRPYPSSGWSVPTVTISSMQRSSEAGCVVAA